LINFDHTGGWIKLKVHSANQEERAAPFAGLTQWNSPGAVTIMSNLTMVRVEHSRGSSVGSLVSDMRTWLDHQGIQPIDFKEVTLPCGGVAFDLEFRHVDQATLFRAAFAE